MTASGPVSGAAEEAGIVVDGQRFISSPQRARGRAGTNTSRASRRQARAIRPKPAWKLTTSVSWIMGDREI
jgi:hypothetical protein